MADPLLPDASGDPRFKLICFPHAGGAAHSFAPWGDALSAGGVEMVALTYPGRGARTAAAHGARPLPTVDTMAALVEDLWPDIVRELDRPFALFGHSLGGLVAYAVCKRLRQEGLPLPARLFVSSVQAPTFHTIPEAKSDDGAATESNRLYTPLSDLDDDRFVREAFARGWFPEQAMENSELRSLVLPTLRADMAIYDSYRRECAEAAATQSASNALLHELFIEAFGGRDDISVPPSTLSSWSPKRTHIIDGAGHFHTKTHAHEILPRILSSCRRVLEVRPPSVSMGRYMKFPAEEFCCHEIFEQQARATPDAVCVVDARRGSLTFSQVLSESHLLARRLQEGGVGPGLSGVVGVLSSPSADFLVAMFAVFRAGGAVLPFYVNYTKELIEDLVSSANVAFMLVDGDPGKDLLERVPAVLTKANKSFALVDGWASSLARRDPSNSSYDAKRSDMPALPLLRKFDATTPESIALMAMTSGSSGKPKAIVVSHRATVVSFAARWEMLPYCETDIVASNIFFVWEAIRGPMKGIPVHVIPDHVLIDPKLLVRFLRKCRATRLCVTAQLTQNMLNYPGLDLKRDLAAMKIWMLMGEVCPRSLVSSWNERLLPSSELWNVYSTWESEDVSYKRLSNPESSAEVFSASKFASAGYPMPNVGIFVLDRSTGVPVPQGVLGDVFIGTRAMSHGYFNDPIKTKAQFKPNHFLANGASLNLNFLSPWGDINAPPAAQHLAQLYATGDRGRILADGQLEIAGRGDAIVKIRGFKVGLPYVENALQGCNGVKSACVQPVMNVETEQPSTLVAYVVGDGEDGEGLTAKNCELILKQIREKVPSYAVPGFIISMPRFPTRPGSGKLDKTKLPDPLGDVSGYVMVEASQGNALNSDEGSDSNAKSTNDGSERRLENSIRSDQLKKIIMEAWRRVLGSSASFGLHDNFFEIGGHSLRAATLVGDLIDSFGLKITVLDLYSHPTVATLASYIFTLLDEGEHESETRKTSKKQRSRQRRDQSSSRNHSADIAVIGLAGQFPGAPDIESFWKNLQSGVDSLRKFSTEELLARGVPLEVIESDGYVPAGQVVDNADKFDAYFWGIGAEEARMMDPQQRMFLQTAWHALENAGYAPRTGSDFNTGVFAACGIDGYLIHHLDGGAPMKDPLKPGKIFKAEVGNEKDYISTRVSYNLDLGGPSFTVNSACSSGLVAVSQAAHAIQSGQCDVAIAGAASLTFPNFGYLYSEGLVASEDGHVRPFDAAASGTLFGDSVGAVVLKRMDDALNDGDHIWAVLKGSAVTNDGKEKAGYAAPSATAQARAIMSAQRQAGVSSDTISYVECHATATHVGDAIEMHGLKLAFEKRKQSHDNIRGNDRSTMHRGSTSDSSSSHRCALGSVKGNIGHANCAAGITGFIKTVLCLYHRKLVPTAHFENINDKINFAGTPFYVQRKFSDWDHDTLPHPRRAGVSSFGVGGTNVHVVLEEAPNRNSLSRVLVPRDPSDHVRVNADPEEAINKITGAPDENAVTDEDHLLVFSAKTPKSLWRIIRVYAEFLKRADTPPLRDIAYTLGVGREHMQYRISISCHNKDNAAEQLIALIKGGPESDVFKNKINLDRSGKAIFVFPGQGSQYLGMGKQLYESEPLFRRHMNTCAAIVDKLLLSSSPSDIITELQAPILNPAERSIPGMGLLSVLHATWSESVDAAKELFARPALVQPCIFATEYSLARTLQDYGVQPMALGGHSIGEFVAATLSGVFSLEIALKVMLVRGVATEREAEEGAMLSVKMSNVEVQELLARYNSKLTVAASNAPLYYVLSGETEACVSAKLWLESQGKRASLLHVNRAFHSNLMNEASSCLEDFLRQQKLAAPRFPVTSNVTGAWMDSDDVTSAEYWGEHMRSTVKFADNVSRLLKWSPSAIVEIGPGSTLCKLIAKCQLKIANDSAQSTGSFSNEYKNCALIQSMRHPNNDELRDSTVFSRMLGNIWKSGIDINFEYLHTCAGMSVAPPQRVPIPGYSFEPTSHWINPRASIYVKFDSTAAEAETIARAEIEELVMPTIPSSSNPRLLPLSPAVAPGGQILFCFPYAGGSSRLFSSWAEEAERVGSTEFPSVQVIAVELPGRGARLDEPISDCIESDTLEILEITNAIRAHMFGIDNSVTCVLCGLSMGALIAWKVATLLSDLRGKLTGIMLAGRVPPFGKDAPPVDVALNEEELEKYNLASLEVRASEAWQEHFLPLLKSDLRLDERLARGIIAHIEADVSQTPPQLPSFLNLTVCCGMDDLSFPWTSAIDWKAIGGASFKLSLMQGGHEFLQECAGALFAASTSQHSVPKMHLGHIPIGKDVSVSRGDLSRRPTPLLRIQWCSLAPLEELWNGPSEVSNPGIDEKIKDRKDPSLWSMDSKAFQAPTMRLSSSLMDTMDATMIRRIADSKLLVLLVAPREALDDSNSESFVGSPSELIDYEISQCWSFMKCAQKLIASDIEARIVMVFPDELTGSMIVGASRSLSLEFPELQTQRLFLECCSSMSAKGLIEASKDNHNVLHQEPDIALRGDLVYVRRALPQRIMKWPSRSVLSQGRASLKQHKLYVVTGGTGGIGTELVNWLIDVQKILPQQIILLSRSASSTIPHPRGCIMVKMDLSKPGALDQCTRLTRIIEESGGVEGIFHLAGVLSDSMIINMTRDKLNNVVSPKALSLLEILNAAKNQNWGTKWALAFSSTTSLLGYPGQSNYAAANAFLDGLMHVTCRSAGKQTQLSPQRMQSLSGEVTSAKPSSLRIPVIVCNWGPWGDVGMAKKGSKAYHQSLKGGESPMKTQDAFHALESLLRIVRDEFSGPCIGGGETLQFSICRTGWSYTSWKGHPLIAELDDDISPALNDLFKVGLRKSTTRHDATGGSANGMSVDRGQAQRSPKSEVETFLASKVSMWMPSETLTALGVDSLDEVQLRNDFQRAFDTKIPLSTFVIPNQTLGALAAKLQAHLESSCA